MVIRARAVTVEGRGDRRSDDFAERGSESVATDAAGRVYLALYSRTLAQAGN